MKAYLKRKYGHPRSLVLPGLIGVLLLLAWLHFTSGWYREKIAYLFADNNQRLLQAAVVNNLDEVNRLMLKGVDINFSNRDRWTALHFAAHEGYDELVQTLCVDHAKLEARNNMGWTPLHAAVYQNRGQAAAVLLRRGADIRARNSLGNSPLHLAVFQNNPAMVVLLLRCGAQINQKNDSGSTPLDFAVHQQLSDMTTLLLQLKADPDSAKRPDLDKDSTPPLGRAAMYGNLPIAAILLRYHADINRPDNRGNTPLHEASRRGHASMVAFLLQQRADSSLRNLNGKTALDIASDENIRKLLASPVVTAQAEVKSDKNRHQGDIVFPAAAKRKL